MSPLSAIQQAILVVLVVLLLAVSGTATYLYFHARGLADDLETCKQHKAGLVVSLGLQNEKVDKLGAQARATKAAGAAALRDAQAKTAAKAAEVAHLQGLIMGRSGTSCTDAMPDVRKALAP